MIEHEPDPELDGMMMSDEELIEIELANVMLGYD